MIGILSTVSPTENRFTESNKQGDHLIRQMQVKEPENDQLKYFEEQRNYLQQLVNNYQVII